MFEKQGNFHNSTAICKIYYESLLIWLQERQYPMVFLVKNAHFYITTNFHSGDQMYEKKHINLSALSIRNLRNWLKHT